MRKYISFIVIIAGVFYLSCQKKIVPGDSTIRLKPYDTASFDYLYVEAIKQKLLGNNGDALKYLEQCLKINQNSGAACFEIAQIAFSIGDKNTGKKYAVRALSLEPQNFWYLMILGGTYLQEENIDSATIFYEKAARLFPEKENVQLTLANLYSENKKYGKANEIFNSLNQKYGINNVSTTAQVKNLISEGRYSEAEQKTLELIKEYPDEIMFQGLLAEIYRAKGETKKATDVFNSLIERNPNNPDTQLSLSDFLITEKNYDELIVLLNTIILNEEIRREDKISLFGRIIEIPEIIKSYGERLQFSLMILEASYKDDLIISLLMPELLIARGNLVEASEKLEGIIHIYPDNYYAWEKLLFVYFQERNFKKLEEKGKECASKFNRSFNAKVFYATAASENRHYEIALDELRKAGILAGDDKELLIQVLSLKADVYFKMGDNNNSFKTFEEALNIDSEDLTILNNYAYYLAERDTRLKEAEIMARKVIEKEKNNTTFLDTYAWVLYKRGKTRDAERVMQSIIKSDEKPDPEWYDHYGYILMKMKNCSEAVKNWEIAIKLDSTKTVLLKEIEKCRSGR
jgi:predicted Zn-dependent protease